jgi:hypothetical protein
VRHNAFPVSQRTGALLVVVPVSRRARVVRWINLRRPQR